MFGRNKKQDEGQRQGFVKRLRARLNRGDSWLTYDLANIVPGGAIDDDVIEELETALIMADVGVDATEQVIAGLQRQLARKELKDIASLNAGLRTILTGMLQQVETPLLIPDQDSPFVILMIGVNGAGKTTTIGKLARHLKNNGYSVMLAAADTFRAAAIEQLQAWGDKNDVAVVAKDKGTDPAAVLPLLLMASLAMLNASWRILACSARSPWALASKGLSSLRSAREIEKSSRDDSSAS